MNKLISTIFVFILIITAFSFIHKAQAQTVGDTLTGHYTYYDPEGDPEGQSIYIWNRDGVAIQGANQLTYTVTSQDVGHTLTFEVIPVALTGTSPGSPIYSSGILITAPVSQSSGGGGGGGSIGIVIPASTSTPVITYVTGTSTATTTLSNIVSTTSSSTNNGIGNIISSIKRLLKYGMTGADVRSLQIYLNTHGYIIAKSGPGSPGHETTLFGLATKATVIKFQKANHIVPAVGNVGPLTRGVMN